VVIKKCDEMYKRKQGRERVEQSRKIREKKTWQRRQKEKKKKRKALKKQYEKEELEKNITEKMGKDEELYQTAGNCLKSKLRSVSASGTAVLNIPLHLHAFLPLLHRATLLFANTVLGTCPLIHEQSEHPFGFSFALLQMMSEKIFDFIHRKKSWLEEDENGVWKDSDKMFKTLVQADLLPSSLNQQSSQKLAIIIIRCIHVIFSFISLIKNDIL
jgi:hypothetical protein